jgi:hypothetical protein
MCCQAVADGQAIGLACDQGAHGVAEPVRGHRKLETRHFAVQDSDAIGLENRPVEDDSPVGRIRRSMLRYAIAAYRCR